VAAVQRLIMSPDAVCLYQVSCYTIAGYACVMYSAWNSTDIYGIIASVCEV
jgi:hypothetical protein